MSGILIPMVCVLVGVGLGVLLMSTRGSGHPLVARFLGRFNVSIAMLRKIATRLYPLPYRLLKYLRSLPLGRCIELPKRLWSSVKHVDVAQSGEKLRECLKHANLSGKDRSAPDVPEDFARQVDLGALNCRVRIGRQPKDDAWQSVLVVEICGTIESPSEEQEVNLEVTLADLADDSTPAAPALSRPKHGSLQGAPPFKYETDMGKLCHQTTVLEDWTAVAQISPEWFILPRQGHRKLHYNIAIVSRSTGQQLATATCTAAYENIETGYLDIEDNIQRAKTLAVGLAFTVGAVNHTLGESEINIIHAWVSTNFGSVDASEDARLELERALRKTATFFHRGGQLNLQEICGEIVEIAPMVGRLDILDLCLRVAAAKGQVNTAELTLLKDLAEWLQIDRARLRTMVEKRLPISMHQGEDAEIILGVTTEMSKDEARHQLNREYAKWSSRVISSDPSIRKQADQMLNLIADARTQYVGVKLSKR